MRFDKIDLFGDFKIAGLTGGPGQVLGITQGQIGWITVASSGGGGGVGAQGPTGPSTIIPSASSPFIGICGNLIAGESRLFFDFDKKNFRSGYGNFCMTATNSAIISSSGNVYIDGTHNVALSSCGVCIIGNNSGQKNNLTSFISSKYGGIVDGNSDTTSLSSIISSKQGYFKSSVSSVIVSSAKHTNGFNDVIRRSAFISSNYSLLCNVDTTVISGCYASGCTTNSSFIMGAFVCIERSNDSVIMASGFSCITDSHSSVIIGSKNSWIDTSHNTVILGGVGLTASNCLNTTIVQRLQCLSKINFCSTVEPGNLENGMIWYRNGKLWVRMNGQTGTFSLVT
jgi:hypothetical protein